MLRQIFQSEPVRYMKSGEEFKYTGYLLGVTYLPEHHPYVESIYWVSGIIAAPYPLPTSPISLYLFAAINTNWWPSWGVQAWRFDGTTGRFIKELWVGSWLGAVLYFTNDFQRSRSGKFWCGHHWSDRLLNFTLGAHATCLIDEEPKVEGPTIIPVEEVYPNHFEGSVGFFYQCAIDDVDDRFIMQGGGGIQVWEWKSGKFLYEIETPPLIADMCLEDRGRMYILHGTFGNQGESKGTVVLFDYLRGEVLGASKIPPPEGTTSYWNNSNIRMGWDSYFRRILITESTPDNPDHSSTVRIRGFRAVPEPVRLTEPIPLKAPRQGRTIPVLVQVLGAMNEGVGGYVVNAKVSGSGSLVGLPITDHYGNAIIQVACEGSPNFSASSDFDWSTTGSPEDTPPHTGLVIVEASAFIYAPDPEDIPVSGAAGPSPSGGWAGGPSPGQPSGGSGDDTVPGDLPATAPNMKYILDALFAEKPWDFSEWNEDNPTGRGQFTEEGVQRIHDVDARFGHIRKRGGQNQYNGHAVDALNFKCDDGVTAEIYDIAGGKPGSKPAWHFWKRLPENLDKWYYPA